MAKKLRANLLACVVIKGLKCFRDLIQSLEFKIGSLESEEIIIGSLEKEKLGPYRSISGT